MRLVPDCNILAYRKGNKSIRKNIEKVLGEVSEHFVDKKTEIPNLHGSKMRHIGEKYKISSKK